MSSWLYKIFFSVDLENSTRYKSKSSTSREFFAWSKKFESFYALFDTFFKEKCAVYKKLPSPTMWKLVGDEILYYCDIKDSASVLKYVSAFLAAIKEYNIAEHQKFSKSSSLPELLCKGTIWGAGFPIRNRVVKTPLSTDDFLGLDIDIGFRLSKFSSSDKTVVSLPIAYILSLHDYEGLRYFDRLQIKGVDSQYPVFWLDAMHKDRERLELEWERTCNHQSVVKYCEKLFDDDFSKPFIRPFIEKDKSGKCSEISEAAKKLKKDNDKLESSTEYEANAGSGLKRKGSRQSMGISEYREKFLKK